jgi:hypothetical protein
MWIDRGGPLHFAGRAIEPMNRAVVVRDEDLCRSDRRGRVDQIRQRRRPNRCAVIELQCVDLAIPTRQVDRAVDDCRRARRARPLERPELLEPLDVVDRQRLLGFVVARVREVSIPVLKCIIRLPIAPRRRYVSVPRTKDEPWLACAPSRSRRVSARSRMAPRVTGPRALEVIGARARVQH